MKHIYLLAIIASLFNSCSSSGPQGYLCGENVAVFYPSDFQTERLMPSLAIIHDLVKTEKLPSSWEVRPIYTGENNKNVILFALNQEVDYYGTGEVVGNLRRNGTDITLWNTDNYGYTGANGKSLYQSHPWILGVRKDGSSFGIIIDNTYRQSISISDTLRITTDGPAPRVVIIERSTPQDVVKELGNLTGKIDLPPLWALGYQQCRFSYYPQEKVKEIATEFRKRNIPCDVIWMDIDYMEGRKVFTFNPKGFSDPKGLNDYLHSIDFKSVYMVDPGIKVDKDYEPYVSLNQGNHGVQDAQGNEAHGDVWPGSCAFPDFTRPETREWWISIYKKFMANGIDGIWNDMNEPALFRAPAKTLPDSSLHRGGGNLPADIHLRYHNVYGLLMTMASREGVMAANPNKRPFVLSRANFLGGHRYSATWTGDNSSTWDYLRMSIPMSINLSLSGQVFNGADIGGFGGNSNGELLSNWTALGVFYPFMRNHSADNTIQQEPWSFGPEVEQINRTAINRRYMLLPYIYTQMYDASQTGMSVMRPAFMCDIKDLALRNEQEAFTLGGDLLVIPRWSSPTLPSGDWDLLKLEEEDDGVQPLLALRPGAIVPIGNIIQSTEDYNLNEITLLVNPGADGRAEGFLYDDAGDGFQYKEGDYALYHLSAETVGQRTAITVEQTDGKAKRLLRFRVGYVTDDNITYSDYTTQNEIIVDVVIDPLSKLVLPKEMNETILFPNKDLSKAIARRGRRQPKNANY